MATIVKARARQITRNGRKVTVKGVGYTVRWQADGKQSEKTFKTQREALDWKTSVEHSLRTHTYVDPKAASESFGDAARRMIDAQPNRNTREAYAGALNHLPTIINRPLRSVANDRQGVKVLCANHPMGKRMLTVIRLTCQEAVNDGTLTGHRLAGLKSNHVPGVREMIPHTREQLDTMAAGMGKDGLAVYIMRFTGVRLGEVLALRKSDFVQSVDGTWNVHVARQVQHGEIVPLKHRRNWDGRDIPVPAWLAEQVMARPETGRMFTLADTSFRQKFVRHAVKAGLPRKFTPHQCRHGYASTLLSRGIAITDVARWMGDEIRTVARVYAHLMPGQAARALEILESSYGLTEDQAA